MIRPLECELPAGAIAGLAAYQQEVDGAGCFADRVASAKELFIARRSTPTLALVSATLARMCHGARRCMYCEGSSADQVEHFRPKDCYPELVFVWTNYLYACGPCNRIKSNQFAVHSSYTGLEVEVSRPRGAPCLPPEPGEALLIDPRQEDPLDYLRLDLRGSGLFQETYPVGSLGHSRARYTLEVLGLNSRDDLALARASVFVNYCATLERYILLRERRSREDALLRCVAAIANLGHRTVWVEMQRQRQQVAELRRLFEAAPEALSW